ncbi:MAG: cytochrome c3 family protein [Candidatus Syntropharchaeales archaeon]
MRKTHLLLMLAVIITGIFALPQTVALFSGQHSWYNLSVSGNDLPCEKCHGDIADEMNSLVSAHSGETGYGRMECGYCHRLFPIQHQNGSFTDYTYASGDGTGSTPGKEAHAASTVPCMYCHSGDKSGVKHTNAATFDCGGCHVSVHGDTYTDSDDCRRCHANAATGHVYYIPPAGGFNLTINTSDTGSNAAHKKFVLDSIENVTMMEDANEACIGCHTGVGVNISWTKNVVLEFSASENEYGNWSIPDFSAAGSNVTASTYKNNWTNSY